MYKISKENRDTIIQYLNGSQLPHRDVVQLIQLLQGLEEVKEEKKEEKNN